MPWHPPLIKNVVQHESIGIVAAEAIDAHLRFYAKQPSVASSSKPFSSIKDAILWDNRRSASPTDGFCKPTRAEWVRPVNNSHLKFGTIQETSLPVVELCSAKSKHSMSREACSASLVDVAIRYKRWPWPLRWCWSFSGMCTCMLKSTPSLFSYIWLGEGR